MRFFAAAALCAILVSGQQIQCATGLQLFVSRGTGEAPGQGVTGNITQAVLGLIPGSSVQPIDYPATLENPSYFDSVRNGTKTLRESLIEYTSACPNTKIAVLGYSQAR
ncbi:hypothetical protein jhhlp_005009 [Lomentospora prolificans]|uniref:Cutinase n=1 Tax=Lomentospora prolificans TaxID=41688 RepID=A0A2N3N8D7_9PEZI|nr:hypothetical protein jhhlp_005009 [Lomentospora prolificans]